MLGPRRTQRRTSSTIWSPSTLRTGFSTRRAWRHAGHDPRSTAGAHRAPPRAYRRVEQAGDRDRPAARAPPRRDRDWRRLSRRAHACQVRADRAPADAPDRWRLPPRPSPRAGAARRGQRRRGPHHGIEVRSAADACRRRRGGCTARRSAPPCHDVAERVGFEPTVRLHAQRFSRPSRSTTLAPLPRQAAGRFIEARARECNPARNPIDSPGSSPITSLPHRPQPGRRRACAAHEQEATGCRTCPRSRVARDREIGKQREACSQSSAPAENSIA